MRNQPRLTTTQRRLNAQRERTSALLRASKLPNDTSFVGFMSTGAFDPMTLDELGQETGITAMQVAFHTVGIDREQGE